MSKYNFIDFNDKPSLIPSLEFFCLNKLKQYDFSKDLEIFEKQSLINKIAKNLIIKSKINGYENIYKRFDTYDTNNCVYIVLKDIPIELTSDNSNRNSNNNTSFNIETKYSNNNTIEINKNSEGLNIYDKIFKSNSKTNNDFTIHMTAVVYIRKVISKFIESSDYAENYIDFQTYSNLLNDNTTDSTFDINIIQSFVIILWKYDKPDDFNPHINIKMLNKFDKINDDFIKKYESFDKYCRLAYYNKFIENNKYKFDKNSIKQFVKNDNINSYLHQQIFKSWDVMIYLISFDFDKLYNWLLLDGKIYIHEYTKNDLHKYINHIPIYDIWKRKASTSMVLDELDKFKSIDPTDQIIRHYLRNKYISIRNKYCSVINCFQNLKKKSKLYMCDKCYSKHQKNL